MFFSVIIPTYNRVDLLRRALESVWAQDFHDYEIVVVDDGSHDETMAYLESLGGKVRAFRQENAGPGAARNLAASHAQGDYLAFLDSDDVWFSTTLGHYAKAIRDFGRPAVVAGTGIAEGQGTRPVCSPEFVAYPSLLDACVGFMPPVGGTPSVTVRRDVFEKVGGFCARKINAEDVDLWLRLGGEKGFVRITSPPVFQQSYLEISASRDMRAQVAGVDLVMDQERAQNYPGGRFFRERRLKIITAMARSVSFDCLLVGDFANGLGLYRRSFSLQLAQRRVRYLLGYPVKWAWQKARSFR